MTIRNSATISADLKISLDNFPFRDIDGLHTPELGELEKSFLADCIDSGYVSSVGEYVDRFESELAQFSGAQHVVATSSGTTALHLALIGIGVKPGDIVIVPAITFVATANAVAYCGATALALDVEGQSMGLDQTILFQFLETETKSNPDGTREHTRTGAVVRAVLAMHVLGHPCDIEAIAGVCSGFGVALLEDAAESIGSYAGNTHTGLFGLAGIFSFNGNKTITTGGGGCVVTNDSELARRVRHLGTTARIPDPFEFDHDEIGFNYRMPNINAALGCAQMERLPALLSGQKELHQVYVRHFSNVEAVEVIVEPSGRRSNYWMQAIRLRQGGKQSRDALLNYGAKLGIPLRPLWKPIPLVRAYRDGEHGDMPLAREIYDSVVLLPSSPSLLRSLSNSSVPARRPR